MKEPILILIATDYSEVAINGEKYAIQFARQLNATIVFLHVYTIPVNKYQDSEISTNQTIENEVELKKLKDHRDKLLRLLNSIDLYSNCECIAIEGKPSKQICKTAIKLDADFIILGNHGADNSNKKLIGRTAWEVIRKATNPVLLIPREAIFKGLNKIVFATEHRVGEIPAVYYLTGLAGKTDAELIVLHATDHTLNKDYDKKVFETFKIELQTKIKYKELKVLILENKNIVEGIDQFCTETKADLLVTSPEKPPLLERIFMPNYPFTNKMSLHTKMPLLTVPDYYSPDYRAFWKIFEMDEQFLEDLL
jgi:nucleotide-binding universal stress UspA family protein